MEVMEMAAFFFARYPAFNYPYVGLKDIFSPLGSTNTDDRYD